VSLPHELASSILHLASTGSYLQAEKHGPEATKQYCTIA